MKNYSEYHITDLGVGLNRYNSVDNIPDGQMVTLKNLDPRGNGQLVTRPGFEQYYGSLPLRASKITKTDAVYKIEFDTAISIDLSNTKTGPIIVSGDLPSSAGTFSGDFSDTFATKYYETFDVTFLETFPSGSPATVTKTAAQTGLTQSNVFIGWFQSDVGEPLDNTVLVPSEVRVSTSSYQIEFDHVSVTDTDGYFGYLEVPTEAGRVYTHTLTAATSETIDSATHGLQNDNFIIRCYSEATGTLTEVIPQEITANSSGDITITFNAAVTGRCIIYATDNFQSESAVLGSQTLQVTGVTSPFNVYELWATIAGTRTVVTPASISWDAATSIAYVEYVGPGAEAVEVNWQELNYVANAIEFTGTDGGDDFVTTEPEITVWGIPHTGIYKDSAPKGGFSHHIDNYKSENTERIVTALGGNLMQATSYADGATTYKMASLTLRGSNRVSGAQILAPLFNAASTSRTRGDAYDATAVDGDGYAKVTAVNFESTGRVNYTFTFDNLVNGASIASYFDTNDFLTVRKCGRSINNGTFRVVDVQGTPSTTSVVIRVENAAAVDDSIDESNLVGQGNVFTDRILLTDTPVFIVGDKVSSGDTNDNVVKAVDVSASNYIFIDGISAVTNISDGINLYVKRTSSVLPLQSFPSETVGSDTLGGLVIGDSVIITGVTQSPKIKYVNTKATTALTSGNIVISGGVATITLANHYLNVGQTVRFAASSDPDFEGEYVVTGVPTSGTFTVATTAADSSTVTATFRGKTIELDEALLLTSGPTTVTIRPQGRWTVVENPKSTSTRVQETKTRHWDESIYVDQPYLKSVIVNDSMYLVNDTDEVKKFDGTTLTNAGLVPWQGWFFAGVDSDAGALPSGRRLAYSAVDTGNKFFTVAAPVFEVGDRVKDADTGSIYTLSSVEDIAGGSTTAMYVVETMNSEATGGTDELIGAIQYRYYVRLNALDANRNIIASASLGADDMYVDTFTSSAIQLKFGGLPPFAELDHDRIELEIYRTRGNVPGQFYRVHRKLLDYGDLGGYITWTDTKTDDQLVFSLQDEARPIGLAPSEIGNTWTNPPLASVITTVDNRLILANIKSPPTLDITFNDAGTSTPVAADFVAGGGEVQFQVSGTTTANFNNSAVFSFESSAGGTLTGTSEIIIANPTTSHTWVDADLTIATDLIAETAHGLKTGTRVRVSTSGDELPSGLAVDTDYYVVRIDADTYKLATTFANAMASTVIDLGNSATQDDTFTTTVYGPHVVLLDADLADEAAGSWIYLFHAAVGENNRLDFAGWYRLSQVDPTGNAVLIEMDHNRATGFATAEDVDTWVASGSSTFSAGERVPVWVGNDGNFIQSFYSSASFLSIVATRLGLAINAVMSSDPPSNAYWNGTRPTPWLMAQSGLSFNTGSLRVNMVDNPTGIVNMQWSGISSDVETYVNSLLVSESTDAPSQIRLFNSRLAVSYPNFPEVFDDPYSDDGYSVIDVNPADGQEITFAVPFFGQSAFGAANLTQVVVVAKTRSIYLVSVESGQTQKLQTQGQGCTAPRSVAVTRDGIVFANESGIWRLGWDMRISWVGRMADQLWKKDLELTALAEFAGHNYAQGQQYKLSTVIAGSSYPSNVLVYDHTREQSGQPGSWTEYTNHAATGWTNQSSDSFFGNQSGQVFKIRNSGTMTDYRDDASPVAEQQLVTGGIHYGLPGNRKTTSGFTLQYQNDAALTDINIFTEQSLSGTFNASTQVNISASNDSVRYSLVERKGTFLRVKLTKSGTLDEQLQLSRMTFHVKDIGEAGTKEAAD